MSDDPETARQIAELARDTRPLLVLDVDEVLLEFVRPFTGFLNARKLDLKTTSFRLHGNIVELASGTALANERVTELLAEFFDVQGEWQTAAERARAGHRRSRERCRDRHADGDAAPAPRQAARPSRSRSAFPTRW